MRRLILTLMVIMIPLTFLGVSATNSQAGLGLGVHYLNTLGDIKDAPEFDSGALGFLGVYSFGTSLINFEGGVEWVPNYAGDFDMWQPQGYVFVGNFIYGGVGIGIGYIDGDWQSDPFYALRAGVRISVLDLFVSYRFQTWDIEGLDADDLNSITFGALFKF